MVFHVAVWIWTAVALGSVRKMGAYLTLWGFTICTLYFVLVNFVKAQKSESKLWKIAYVLGELGATLEFLICPFFFAFLFPAILKNHPPVQDIILQVCLHFFCPLFIWIDTICNAIVFPKRHLWFLAFVCLIYPPNNYIWTVYIFKRPVYPVMDWKTWMTFVYVVIAVVLGFAGYFVGAWQYNKKKSKICVDGITQRILPQ